MLFLWLHEKAVFQLLGFLAFQWAKLLGGLSLSLQYKLAQQPNISKTYFTPGPILGKHIFNHQHLSSWVTEARFLHQGCFSTFFHNTVAATSNGITIHSLHFQH